MNTRRFKKVSLAARGFVVDFCMGIHQEKQEYLKGIIDFHHSMVSMYGPDEENSYIRVSCAGFGRIFVDDKYLVCINRRRLAEGQRIYSPFGGAHKFTDRSVKEELKKMGALFDHEYLMKIPKKDWDDLRFLIMNANLRLFENWYYMPRKNQEGRTPQRDFYPTRELEDELVNEEHVITTFEGVAIEDLFLHIREPDQKRRVPRRRIKPNTVGKRSLTDLVTMRYTEIYNVRFTDEREAEAREAVGRNPRLALITPDDILAGEYNSIAIAPIMVRFLRRDAQGSWVLGSSPEPGPAHL